MQKAQAVFNRLREVEKIDLRSASQERLEFLAQTEYAYDLPLLELSERAAIMNEVKALCLLESAQKSAWKGFDGVTWRF